jgi:acetylornithine/succinyldiaminopimelate/putrescine aminotransferase
MVVEIVGADNSYLFDSTGKRYINLSESINVLGHRNPELFSIIRKYLDNGYLHYPLTISKHKISLEVERKLLDLSGIEKGSAIFSSSGSEACDVALSILSEFGPVITLEGAYHGLCGQYLNKSSLDEFKYKSKFIAPFPTDKSSFGKLKELVEKGAKSIIIEIIQVEGGIREVYGEFIKDLKKNFPELIICVDESYTGIWKTGRLFSYQWYDFVPDLLIVGKAIGGGIPLGITLVKEDILKKSTMISLFRNGAFGSTAGNLLGLHLANYILDTVSDVKFLNEVNRKGRLFRDTIGEKLSSITRGKGLLYGIHSDQNFIDKHIQKLIEQGIYVTKMKDVIRISPPLTIPDELLIEAGEKIKNILLDS